jgi:hypothetical protein
MGMTKTQLRAEIRKVIESVPEDVLADVLGFLQELQAHPSDKVKQVSHLRQTLAEDSDLLQRLAQ